MIDDVINLPKTWGKRIKKTNCSQVVFSVKCGISHVTLSKAIKGHVIPRLESIRKVENELKKLGV